MRLAIFLVVLLGGAGALWATNPGLRDFERKIEDVLMAEISAADPAEERDDAKRLLIQTCKIGRKACARLIRSAMEIDIADYGVVSVADVTLGDEGPAKCIGVLNRVICPGT